MSIEISNGFTVTPNISIIQSGLVFNLFTAPSSGTTWTDSSGNGYIATWIRWSAAKIIWNIQSISSL